MDLKIIQYQDCIEENKKRIFEDWMIEWKEDLLDTNAIKLRASTEKTLNEDVKIYALVENNSKQKLVGSIQVFYKLSFIGSFYIVKEYRGKGYGTLLLNWVENEVYKQGKKNANYDCPYTYLQCEKDLKQFYLDRNYHVLYVSKPDSLHNRLYPFVMLKELQKPSRNLELRLKLLSSPAKKHKRTSSDNTYIYDLRKKRKIST